MTVDPHARILNSPPLAESFAAQAILAGRNATGLMTAVRVHNAAGRLAGTVMIMKPAAGMGVLATMAAAGDLRHFERMQRVAKPARHPAAILFADLEGSSSLAWRLSTASYFALGRRLVRAADQCVIDAGGLVKALIERLGPDDAAALVLDPDRITYTPSPV